MTGLDALVASGRLERVPPHLGTARVRLERTEQHLTTADRLVGQDDEVAHGSWYDAARKAITAHTLAHGPRATNRAGAHEAVGRYAVAAITDTAWWEALVSAGVIAATAVLLVVLATRLYRGSLLRTGSKSSVSAAWVSGDGR